jgi:hypothetical protein
VVPVCNTFNIIIEFKYLVTIPNYESIDGRQNLFKKKVVALSRHGLATEELVMVLWLQWLIRSSGRRKCHLSKLYLGNLSLPNRTENKDEAIAVGRRLGGIVGRNDQEEFSLDPKTVFKWSASISL